MLRVTGSMTFYQPNSQPTYFNQLKQTVTHAGHDSSKLKPLRPGIPNFKLRYYDIDILESKVLQLSINFYT